MPARVADDPLVVIRVVYVERDEVAVVVSAVAAVGETVLLVVDVVQLPADVAAPYYLRNVVRSFPVGAVMFCQALKP